MARVQEHGNTFRGETGKNGYHIISACRQENSDGSNGRVRAKLARQQANGSPQ